MSERDITPEELERVTRSIVSDYPCNKHALEWMNEVRERFGLPELNRDEFIAERRALGEVSEGNPASVARKEMEGKDE